MKTKTEIFIILNYMRTNSYKVGNKNECKLSLRKTIEGEDINGLLWINS